MVCVYEGTIKSYGIKAYHTENNETKIYSQNEKISLLNRDYLLEDGLGNLVALSLQG